ncbi:MAG TPA: tetratricopeptide repeat protein, partial [Polyangiaceae bacterium]|nr:tetratricopeptide repeat protein [Polyangiaceae bacterium]
LIRFRPIVALVLCLGVTPWVHAQGTGPSAVDVATARELFREGGRLANEQKWQEALDAYERSMALRPSNLTRYSIGVTLERLNRLVEAMEYLREFVHSDHDSATRSYVEAATRLLRELERRIGRIKVVIPGNPRGAEVRFDNVPIPSVAIGVHRPTDPGHRKIEVRVPGYVPFVKEVDLKEGESVEILVRLHTLADGQGAEDAEQSEEPAAVVSVGQNRSTTAMVLTIGGAGVFATGLGMGLWGYVKAKDADSGEGEDADAARRLALIGDIGMGVGLVAAGIGTYLLFSEEDSTDSSKVRVGPWAAAGAGGLVAVGRF